MEPDYCGIKQLQQYFHRHILTPTSALDLANLSEENYSKFPPVNMEKAGPKSPRPREQDAQQRPGAIQSHKDRKTIRDAFWIEVDLLESNAQSEEHEDFYRDVFEKNPWFRDEIMTTVSGELARNEKDKDLDIRFLEMYKGLHTEFESQQRDCMQIIRDQIRNRSLGRSGTILLIEQLYLRHEWPSIRLFIKGIVEDRFKKKIYSEVGPAWKRLLDWINIFEANKASRRFWDADFPATSHSVLETKNILLQTFQGNIGMRDDIQAYVESRIESAEELANDADSFLESLGEELDSSQEEEVEEIPESPGDSEWTIMYRGLADDFRDIAFAEVDDIIEYISNSDDENENLDCAKAAFDVQNWRPIRDAIIAHFQFDQNNNPEHAIMFRSLLLHEPTQRWQRQLRARTEFWSRQIPDVETSLGQTEELYKRTYASALWFREDLRSDVNSRIADAHQDKVWLAMYQRLHIFIAGSIARQTQVFHVMLDDCGRNIHALHLTFKDIYNSAPDRNLYYAELWEHVRSLLDQIGVDDGVRQTVLHDIATTISDLDNSEAEAKSAAALAEAEGCYKTERNLFQYLWLQNPGISQNVRDILDVQSLLRRRDAPRVKMYAELHRWIHRQEVTLSELPMAPQAGPGGAIDADGLSGTCRAWLQIYAELPHLRPHIRSRYTLTWPTYNQTKCIDMIRLFLDVLDGIDTGLVPAEYYMEPKFLRIYEHSTHAEQKAIRIQLQGIAARWYHLSLIEVVPADLVPKSNDLRHKWRSVYNPSDVRNWGPELLDPLEALSRLSVGQSERATQLLSDCARERIASGGLFACTHLTPDDVQNAIIQLEEMIALEAAGDTSPTATSSPTPAVDGRVERTTTSVLRDLLASQPIETFTTTSTAPPPSRKRPAAPSPSTPSSKRSKPSLDESEAHLSSLEDYVDDDADDNDNAAVIVQQPQPNAPSTQKRQNALLTVEEDIDTNDEINAPRMPSRKAMNKAGYRPSMSIRSPEFARRVGITHGCMRWV